MADRPVTSNRWRRDIVLMVGVFLLYVLTGKVGLQLAVVHANATAVWAPSGLAVAAFLLFGFRLWPAILAGAFVVNVTTAGSVATSASLAVGNTLEGLVAADLVNRFAGGQSVFQRPQDIFKFALAGALASSVAATIGVTTLTMAGYAMWSEYTRIWLTWWLGDVSGVLIVTPVIVLWTLEPKVTWRHPRVVEAALAVISIAVVGGLIFGAGSSLAESRYPLAFLAIPPLMWVAFRFGQRAATTAVMGLCAVAIWGTLRGLGPFAGFPPSVSLLILQAFMATMAMLTVPLAALASEWRRTTEALQREEELFRRIADSVPVTLWMSATDGRKTFFNAAWRTFTGRTAREDIDHGWTEAVHPEDVAAYLHTYASAFRTRQPFEIEYRLRRADGQYRWVLDHGVPRLAADGSFEGYTGGCVDIHERKRTELRLRAQYLTARVIAGSDSLATAVPGVLDAVGSILGWDVGAVWWVDRPAGVVRCGDVWQAPSVNATEFVAASLAMALPIGEGLPGRVSASGVAAWILNVTEDANFPRAEVAARAGLRGAFAFPIALRGQCLGVIEFLSGRPEPPDQELLDMMTALGTQLGQFAERTRSDIAVGEGAARYAAMVQASLDAIITMDHRGRITDFNAAAEAMFWWLRADVLGRDMAEIIIPEHLRERHRVGLARYLATGEGPVLGRRIELTALRADGEEFPIELAIRPIASVPPSFTGYVRDITDRRRAEQQRVALLQRAQRAQTEAESASRLKDEFLATLSHELRTPLNAMVGWATMLLGGHADAAAIQRATTVIHRNAKIQQRIIEDILDVSRIITGQLRIDLQPLDLRPLIEQSVDVLRPAATAKRIAVYMDLDRDLGPVTADAQRLQQVIWNLLSNAVKFTPEEGRIDVRLTHAEHAAAITVRDTGKGIDRDFLPYIFDRFRQEDSTTTRVHGGLGLGLAIVRHLVELHGGTVAAENRTDRDGAVFTVTLPMLSAGVTPDVRVPLAEAGAEGPLAARMARLDGLQILAADDDPDSLELVSAMLTLAGASVTTAASTAEALTSLERLSVDAIVCDVGMPGEDGYSFLRSLRRLADSRRANVPTIAVTAYATPEDQARARQAGFDAYLTKPIDPIVLCETVRRLAVKSD